MPTTSLDETPVPDLAALERMNARFAPTDIGADLSALAASERRALTPLIAAARIMDVLFLRQVWAGCEPLLLHLLHDASPTGRARLDAFLINKGPWSRLDHDAPLVPGVPPKPGGAGFYPTDATRAEVESWLASLSDADRHAASGFFTTVRRASAGGFAAVPYSAEYQGELSLAAARLRAAADASAEPTLQAFLRARADAFLSNDYFESDVRWMELDSAIEPTIGPYEVYEDGWFNAKAAFAAYITIRDAAETAKLSAFGGRLQELEDHLPIAPAFRNPAVGALAPIRVVNVVFAAGDGNRGVQTAAFNLPNDERVLREKGSKSVMLRNVQEAKFRTVLLPISGIVLPADDAPRVAFDAFFTHILLHELMHGLGPHDILVQGRQTTVRRELKEAYSAIEEVKADVSGLWALQYLVDAGALPRALEQTMYTTFLASIFRSIRFGINEAHGKGVAVQLNYFLDRGGVRVTPDGRFVVVPDAIRDAVTALTAEVMTLQAEGRYDKATSMLARLGVVRPEVQRVLDRLSDVPVDIAPRFVTAEALRA
jgi:hypothetical protein